MASASDVRDILALPARPGGAAEKPKGPPKARAKRLDGITRELYALMGDNAPSISLARPKMRDRPKMLAPAAKWVNREFSNSARKDKLQLRHWVKESEDAEEEYKFAKFNTNSNPLSFDDEEYEQHLKAEGWTRAETDFLFQLCRDYDLRFIVVADRWLDSEFDERPLEDLKDRYYDCCRKLILARPPTSDEAARTQLAQTYAFDKNREVSRKDYLRSLIKRSKEQIQEELMLYTESRRLEQEYITTAREREDLLRSLAGPGALMALPPNMVSFGPTGNMQSAQNFSQFAHGKRGRLTGDESGAAVAGGGKRHKIDPAWDAQHHIVRHNGPQGPAGVFLRSQRAVALKPQGAQAVRDALMEMGISQRLVMPTHGNAERLEGLVIAVSNMVELKRHLDRLEYEVGVSKARAGSVKREASVQGEDAPAATPATASAVSGRKRSVSISSAGSVPNKRTRK